MLHEVWYTTSLQQRVVYVVNSTVQGLKYALPLCSLLCFNFEFPLTHSVWRFFEFVESDVFVWRNSNTELDSKRALKWSMSKSSLVEQNCTLCRVLFVIVSMKIGDIGLPLAPKRAVKESGLVSVCFIRHDYVHARKSVADGKLVFFLFFFFSSSFSMDIESNFVKTDR